VTITRPGTGVFRVSVGGCLFASDLIETGADGRVIITFTDGSKFRLGGGAALALEDMLGAETARGAALIRILKGVFAFVSGRSALGRFAIDTPVGRIQTSASALGIGSLTFGVLTLGLIHDLKAASADIGLLDDGVIDYKDLKHGVFEIRTKEGHPRIIVVDDPSVTIVLRPHGGGTVGVDEVANTPAQMAQLQSAFQSAYSTFTQGQQDPFIQQLEDGTNDHANAQPQSAPGSVGSSTAANDLNSGGQGLGQIGGTQLALNVGGGGPSGALLGAGAPIGGITTPFTLPIAAGPTSIVQWVSTSGGNWDSASNWSDGFIP
jgi:FecR protein